MSLNARLFGLFIVMFVLVFAVMIVVVFVIVVFSVILPVVPAVVLLVVNDVLFVCKFQVTNKLLLQDELLTVLMETLRCIVFGRMLLGMLSVVFK